ncbi:MAG: YbjN domain-containing protein [Myxococcales bacterium]|nr:YbjN domain-containing protein [Myxococcales bacterium]
MERERLPPTTETIESFLQDAGWRFVRLTPDTWRLRYRGGDRTFPILVRFDPSGWMTVAIVPYVQSPEDVAAAAALYERLLELNHVLFMAKFSIDDDLDVVLSVEYPTKELDRSELRDALDALAYYADLHYDELRSLATP